MIQIVGSDGMFPLPDVDFLALRMWPQRSTGPAASRARMTC